jgi:hypothetical protein
VKINLDAIESTLKALVESSSQIVSSQHTQPDFPTSLAVALKKFIQEENILEMDDFPKSLILEVSVENYSSRGGTSANDILVNLLQEVGLIENNSPEIEIVKNENLLTGEVILRNGEQIGPRLDKTAAMPALESQEVPGTLDTIPPYAFVIVNGLDTFALNQPVVNIGRRLENNLVIEDPRISREHAQIRAVKGKYVILDLNSSGGTFVNSVRVSQQVLFPGDVISLAGLPLVYGEDTPPAISQTGRVEPFKDQDPSGDHA